MIGSAAVISGGLAVVVTALLVGGGATGPAATLAERALVRERVAAARAALDKLAAQLDAGLHSARRGATAVVAGEEPPELHFGQAADAVAGARALAAEAHDAVRALRSVPRAADGGAAATADVPLPPDGAELAAIEAGLRSTASAAAQVAERRRQAEDVLTAMVAARDSLRAGRLDAATAQLGEARGDRAALVAWEAAPPELSLWLAATDAMIRGVEAMIEAARIGAEHELEAAARQLASLSSDAATADRALRIAIDETAASAVSGPVGRLAAAAAAVEASRAAVSAIAGEVAP